MSALDLQLFGTMELHVDSAAQHNLSTKGKLLLAYLALHPGRAVASNAIAEAIFPDSRAEDPHDLVKKTASEIRRALGSEAYRLSSPGPRLLALNLDGANVDWIAFQRAIKEGDTESLQHAIALHSRPLLESEPLYWAIDEQANCLRLRQRALEALFHQAMEKGDLESGGNWLSHMLKFELPEITIDESLWRQLLKSLLAKQEYGKVQLHYSRLRTFLERTAGRQPEAATQAIYRQAPRSVLLQMVQAGSKKKKTSLPVSANLPNFPFSLIGREGEKRELRSLFDRFRIVTIVGIGGMGKTRLAVQAGHEFGAMCKDGAGFIDLAPCVSGDVLLTIAKALGVKASSGLPLYDAVRDFLSTKCALLIIDNCEQVIDEVADIASNLGRDCPQLYLLMTSRELLGVVGEQVFGLHPLALPETRRKSKASGQAVVTLTDAQESPAVRLFVERACAISPKFVLDDANARHIVELCQLVDGLPLGIEMVASQIGGIPLERIVEDLSRSLIGLRHTKRGVTPRHQSLGAALDWSYARLSEAEKTLFRRLSVFAGGWSLEAAEQVCAGEALPTQEVATALSGLVTKSLVIMEPPGRYSSAYRLLETIRVYASAKLEEADREDILEDYRLRQAHCCYFLQLLIRLSDMSLIKDYFLAVDQNQNNIRNAIQWAFDHPDHVMKAHRMVMALHSYWSHHGSKAESREWHRRFLKTHRDTLPLEQVAASMVKIIDCSIDLSAADSDEALECRQNALEIYRSLGDRKGECDIYFALGMRQSYTLKQDEAYENFQKAYDYYEQTDNRQMVAFILIMMGGCFTSNNEHEKAETVHVQALEIARKHQLPSIEALTLMFRGFSARQRELYDLAEQYFGQSADLYRSIDSQWGVVRSQSNRADMKRRMGEFDEATNLLRTCLAEASEFSNPREAVSIIVFIVRLQLARRDWESTLSLASGLHHLKVTFPDELIPVADELKEAIQAASAHLSDQEVEAIRVAAQTAGFETIQEYAKVVIGEGIPEPA
jgi:predicted ATPase/DNA-binding SARP family transcriptional activator